jgi:hypothetical protein
MIKEKEVVSFIICGLLLAFLMIGFFDFAAGMIGYDFKPSASDFSPENVSKSLSKFPSPFNGVCLTYRLGGIRAMPFFPMYVPCEKCR